MIEADELSQYTLKVNLAYIDFKTKDQSYSSVAMYIDKLKRIKSWCESQTKNGHSYNKYDLDDLLRSTKRKLREARKW